MTGMNGPGRPDNDPAFRPDAEVERRPRRSRQPALTVLAVVAILLLVLAVGIFGGIF
ncbi:MULTISPECIES: hypothetical protein [Dietzia]|uniref:Uncharacterized protein n=2 Tax=Dietzia cinnamea TaxID=321318 RepID=A0A4V2W7P5_9ACTN|nr:MULTISPECIES: hypothetical protein [Dietzia]MBM7231756.1 hypothetical protein [Dietzia cinnamea]MCT1641264.1 hypothetical protein [Dietzia cinnamea]MCT2029062.1 hypothetical protein [Dietzia cinnamea]MCT2034502.1 hypothetical protein [Dietzia cinnamea]MCT2059905.1 hypothetical protein [Dietzia cinnamea]